MFKVNIKDTRTTPMTSIVNFGHISHRISIVNFVNADLVVGDGCIRRITALFAHLISAHNLMSFPLGTITGSFSSV